MGKKKGFSVPHKENLDHIKEVPLKEDVDIEFEYKIYILYERLKKYKFLILGVFVGIILVIVASYFYQKHKEERINEASVIFYNLEKAYNENKYNEAKKFIEKLKNDYKDTGYYKLALSYELLIKKEKNQISVEDIDNLKNSLNTEDLKGYLSEYQAYIAYKNEKYNDALDKLNSITQQNFNYISALTLKGIVLIKEKNPQFKQVLEEVVNLSQYDYFKQVAKNLIKINSLQEDKR